MEEILQVITRLSSLLEQYDNSDQILGQMEMSREGISRFSSDIPEGDRSAVMAQNSKGITAAMAQRKAYERAILDITGMVPGELRDKLAEVKVATERAGEMALEEKRLRRTFEIVAAADAFTTEPGESRAEFEQQLSTFKNTKEIALSQLTSLVNSLINKKAIVGASDSVIKLIQQRN